MTTLYREIFVWKRLSENQSVRYSCFENLASGRFCVQSADFFSLPIDRDILRQHERQFVELFVEIDPEVRTPSFATLQAAIASHDADFA